MDLDLGNYERFIDIKLTRDNNITTGKIYQASCLCLDFRVMTQILKIITKFFTKVYFSFPVFHDSLSLTKKEKETI